MSKITVEVVEHEGEKLFKTGEIMFDVLEAIGDFIDGALVVKRQDQTIAKTVFIFEYGTVASLVVFVFETVGPWMAKRSGKPGREMIAQLLPADFEIGDTIDIETVGEFDYVDYLQTMKVMSDTFHRMLPNQGKVEVPIDDLVNEMANDLKSNLLEVEKQKILRFKR